MTINKKVRNRAHVQNDMIERERPVVCAVFSKNLRRVDFQDFFRFVADRSFTADSSLLQPTGGCEHHTSHVVFSHRITCTRMAQGSSLGPHSFHYIHASCALCERCV